jgi:pimeloyl-ACP methyl ester carboxylesterase
LVIHGTADRTVPFEATGRVVADQVPGAQLVEYPGEPHAVFATQTQRLCQDLLRFLGGEVVDNRQEMIDLMTAEMIATQPL